MFGGLLVAGRHETRIRQTSMILNDPESILIHISKAVGFGILGKQGMDIYIKEQTFAQAFEMLVLESVAEAGQRFRVFHWKNL
jgi:hypothetical protein